MRYKTRRNLKRGGDPDLIKGNRVEVIQQDGIDRIGTITEKGKSMSSQEVMYKIKFDDGNQWENGRYKHGQVRRLITEPQTPSGFPPETPPSTPRAGRKRKTLKKKLRSKKRKTYKRR